MRLGRNHPRVGATIGFGLMLILSAATVLFGFAWPALEIQADSTLPPVDPPTPTPTVSTPTEDRDDSDDVRPLGYIALQAVNGSWSVVQWQDSAGNWHDVEGWRGSLGSGYTRRWAVEAKDFNTGPFRWLVLSGEGGQVIGTSEPFNLPAAGNETIYVIVN